MTPTITLLPLLLGLCQAPSPQGFSAAPPPQVVTLYQTRSTWHPRWPLAIALRSPLERRPYLTPTTLVIPSPAPGFASAPAPLSLPPLPAKAAPQTPPVSVSSAASDRLAETLDRIERRLDALERSDSSWRATVPPPSPIRP